MKRERNPIHRDAVLFEGTSDKQPILMIVRDIDDVERCTPKSCLHRGCNVITFKKHFVEMIVLDWQVSEVWPINPFQRNGNDIGWLAAISFLVPHEVEELIIRPEFDNSSINCLSTSGTLE